MQEFIDAGIIIGTGLLLPDDEDELEDEDSLAAVSNTQLHYGVAALPKDQLCECVDRFDVPDAGGEEDIDQGVGNFIESYGQGIGRTEDKGAHHVLVHRPSLDSSHQTSDVINDNADEYKIITPYLRDQWPDNAEKMVLKISLSQKDSHLWAWFRFGIVSGIIRSCGPLPQKVGDVCRFLWRDREEGEGEQTFDDTNWGNITFLDDGRIKGVMVPCHPIRTWIVNSITMIRIKRMRVLRTLTRNFPNYRV
jgi:hypothetical protein